MTNIYDDVSNQPSTPSLHLSASESARRVLLSSVCAFYHIKKCLCSLCVVSDGFEYPPIMSVSDAEPKGEQEILC